MKPYPDPILTASLFADGYLDDLFCRVIVPAALELGLEPTAGHYLWLVRYGLGGDHWKLRFHGEPAEGERLFAALEEHAASTFSLLPEQNGPGKRIHSTVPLDADERVVDEKEVDEEGADAEPANPRQLVRTVYRRHHVSLATAALHEQDAYCAAFTRAMAHGTSALIQGVEAGAEGEWSHGARFTFLLKLLSDGIAELALGASEEKQYIVYHRDTLLRSTSDDGEKSIADGIAVFDRRLDKMADGGARLVKFARGRIDNVRGAAGTPQPGLWQGGLAAGYEAIVPLVAAVEGRIDSYAEKKSHLPLFKIFQGTSNQIGLNVVEEAYVHHILLRALGAGESSP